MNSAPKMTDNAFFDELQRRIAQGNQLARQQKYSDAQTAFYGCLQYADQQRITVPLNLILDMWTNILFCLIDSGQPEKAVPYLDAMHAIVAEWEAIPNKNNPPGTWKSHALMQPLLPPDLKFHIPDKFDAAQWKQRVAYYRQQLATELKTVEDVMQALGEFATFHCGSTQQKGDDVNWYVVKDSLNRFNKGVQTTYTGGLLYLNRTPVIVIGAAVTPEGCWVTLMHEFYFEQVKRNVLKPELNEILPNDKRVLRAFLEALISKGILTVNGDRFKVNLPQS